MLKNVTVSDQANRDLKEIFKYTVPNWGMDLAENYLDKIYQSISSLSEYPNLGKERNNLKCRSLRSEKHIIFYSVKGLEILILRILHQNSNHKNHLGF